MTPPFPQRLLVACAAVAVAAAATAPSLAGAQPAGPSTGDEAPPRTAQEAQERVDAARAEADAAAARLNEAISHYETLGVEIEALKTRIAHGRVQVAELRVVVQERAVQAYTRRGTGDDLLSLVLEGADLDESIRRTALVAAANARDDEVASELEVLEQDLDLQRRDSIRRRAEQEQALVTLQDEKKIVDEKVATAEKASADLKARFAREAAARAAANNVSRSGPAGIVIVNPGGGPFQCPVQGAFSDDFGAPRSHGPHKGTDIFAPTGAPVVAVAAGSVTHEQSGGGGGNMAYVNANGNTYVYAHFSGYAGGPREVVQGEVIGYVGQTGNATAPHLHFEIRTPQGAINPYPTLRQYC